MLLALHQLEVQEAAQSIWLTAAHVEWLLTGRAGPAVLLLANTSCTLHLQNAWPHMLRWYATAAAALFQCTSSNSVLMFKCKPLPVASTVKHYAAIVLSGHSQRKGCVCCQLLHLIGQLAAADVSISCWPANSTQGSNSVCMGVRERAGARPCVCLCINNVNGHITITLYAANQVALNVCNALRSSCLAHMCMCCLNGLISTCCTAATSCCCSYCCCHFCSDDSGCFTVLSHGSSSS